MKNATVLEITAFLEGHNGLQGPKLGLRKGPLLRAYVAYNVSVQAEAHVRHNDVRITYCAHPALMACVQ